MSLINKVGLVKLLSIVFIMMLINGSWIVALGQTPEEARNANIYIELSGLRAVKNATMTIVLSINNATRSQNVEVFQNVPIRFNSSINAQISSSSVLLLRGIIEEREVLRLKIMFSSQVWRVVEATCDNDFIKPIKSAQLLLIRISTMMVKVQLFVPFFINNETSVVITLGNESITPSIEKVHNGTLISFATFINNQNNTMKILIIKDNTSLVAIEGAIPSNGSTNMKVNSIFNEMRLAFMSGEGIIESTIDTTPLLANPFTSKGAIFSGIALTIRSIMESEFTRTVKISIFDASSKKIIPSNISLSIYTTIHKIWYNITVPNNTVILNLPKEQLMIIAKSDGYETAKVGVDANATEVNIYLNNPNPIVKIFNQISSWLIQNWPILAFIFLTAVILILRRRL